MTETPRVLVRRAGCEPPLAPRRVEGDGNRLANGRHLPGPGPHALGIDKGKPGGTRGRKATGLGENPPASRVAERHEWTRRSQGRPTPSPHRSPGSREVAVKAVSTAASTVRHTFGVAFEALLILAIVGALVVAAATLNGTRPARAHSPFAPRPAGAASVSAARGGNGSGGAGGSGGGGPTASIALVEPGRLAATSSWPSVGSDVSFAVSANVKERDLYSLWVANECFQDGVKVYAEYQPARDGTSGPFTLSWADGAASCTAYVWLFPDVGDVLSGGTTTYGVNWRRASPAGRTGHERRPWP